MKLAIGGENDAGRRDARRQNPDREEEGVTIPESFSRFLGEEVEAEAEKHNADLFYALKSVSVLLIWLDAQFIQI